jgi:hypothetical protein
LHHARISRQVYAIHESATRFTLIFGGCANLWSRNSRATAIHTGVAQQRTKLAPGFAKQGIRE